jgi:hypothetical protein
MLRKTVYINSTILLMGICASRAIKIETHFVTSDCSSDPALSPKEFRAFKISKILSLSHNTKAYQVDLPTKDATTVS